MEKQVVLPGDFLGTEEEFGAGLNAFEDDGKILSDSLGRPVFDQKHKVVSVEKKSVLKPLEVDSVVVGRVSMVKSNMVMVEVFFAEKEGEKRVIAGSFAVLPVRNISREFVKEPKDMFRIGDLVLAKVAFVSPFAIDLRTNEPELGVIKAFCVRCRNKLSLFGRTLKCQSCGNSEQRKISRDYLLKEHE